MRSASIVDHVLSLGAERTSPLLLALVQQADLATRLLAVVAPDGAQATPTGGEEGAAPPHLKPCCHAFAMTLAGSLLATAERQPRIAEVLEENAGWAAFTAASGPLAAWEAAQSKPLGGRAPTRQSDMDNESDDEVEFDSNDVQRALAAAQMARSGDNDDDDDTDNDRSSQCAHPSMGPRPAPYQLASRAHRSTPPHFTTGSTPGHPAPLLVPLPSPMRLDGPASRPPAAGIWRTSRSTSLSATLSTT